MKTHRHMQWALPAMIVLVVAAAGAAYAAEGEVTFGTQWWNQTDREPKYFDEYRDLANGPFLRSFVLLDKIDGGRYALMGENAFRHDQSLGLLYRRPRWTVGVEYREIPHNLSYGTRTPFARLAPGFFGLPDSVQLNVQADTSDAQRTAHYRDLLNSARVEPLGFRTDVARAMLKGRIGNGVMLDVRGSRRQREGDKAYSISLGGFSNVVEIPEPINQEIVQGEARLSYLRNRVALEASGGMEAFENAVDALIVDNPRRATDIANGPSRGRLDLYPDNRTVRGALRAGIELPRNSTLNAFAGVSQIRQDDPWLPYTINTALPVDTLPGTDTDAEVVVFTQDYRLHSSPSRYVSGTLRFRRNDYNNNTPEHTFPVEVQYDAARTVEEVTARPFGYINTTYGFDLDVTPVSRLVIGGTAEHTKRDRSLREVTEDKEWAFEGRVNYHPAVRGLVLEGRFRHGDRELEEIHQAELSGIGEQPNLRRFDVADRKQDYGRVRAGVQPNDRSQVSLSYEYLRNKYEDDRLFGIAALSFPTDSIGQLGLLDETRTTLGADVTYDLNDKVSVSGGIGYVKLYQNQRSRTSPATPTAVVDSTWQARIVDRFVYGTAGLAWRPMANRLSFGANFELERAPTTYDLSSIGLRPPAQDLPTTRYRHLGVGVESWYALDKGSTSLGAGWRWDEFSADDFQTTDIPFLYPRVNPTFIFMADNMIDYRAHVVSIMLRRTF